MFLEILTFYCAPQKFYSPKTASIDLYLVGCGVTGPKAPLVLLWQLDL